MSEKRFAPPEEFERIRAAVTPLLELPEDEFTAASQQFTTDRLAELSIPSHREQIDATQGNFQGFIPSDTDYLPLASGAAIHLNDPEMYTDTITLMRQFYQRILPQLGDPRKAYRNAALYTAQYAQQIYFGGKLGTGSGAAAARREALLTENFMDDNAPSALSIANFKDVAACAERAAAANNVLQLLGLQPVLEMGTLQIGSQPDQSHVSLFVRNGKGQEILYDPTNPILVFDTSNNLLQTDISMFPAGDTLTIRDHMQPIAGIQSTYAMVGSEKRLRSKEMYQFWLSPYGQELHPQ